MKNQNFTAQSSKNVLCKTIKETGSNCCTEQKNVKIQRINSNETAKSGPKKQHKRIGIDPT